MSASYEQQASMVHTVYAALTRDLIVALAQSRTMPTADARRLLENADHLLQLGPADGAHVEAARRGLRDAIGKLPSD